MIYRGPDVPRIFRSDKRIRRTLSNEEPTTENEDENTQATGRDFLSRMETAIEERLDRWGETNDDQNVEITYEELKEMERQIDLNPQKSYRDPSTSSDEDENGNQSQPGNARQAETTKLIRQAKEQTAMLAQQKALLNESLQAEENNEEDEILLKVCIPE